VNWRRQGSDEISVSRMLVSVTSMLSICQQYVNFQNKVMVKFLIIDYKVESVIQI
jgi:hypothetical protein